MIQTGRLIYYGDNKQPGRQLHDTPRFGNSLLRDLFNWAHSRSGGRNRVAPILVFGNAGNYRDVVFLGLAIPGAPDLGDSEDLVAVWKTLNGRRFQNYRANLTILDAPMISRAWVRDVANGNPFSEHCPSIWRKWSDTGAIHPLIAEPTREIRSKSEQLPDCANTRRIVELIHGYFSDWPVGFERCAAELTRMMDANFVSFILTRPSRDGGRDAIGEYRIGSEASAILVEFALEAKCYGLNNSVGVRELSRLISRLRHRQFGVMVTTSFVNTQAYKEIKEDSHPIIVVAATDIVQILRRAELNSLDLVAAWLHDTFPK